MKKTLFFALGLITSSLSYSQVGIGVTGSVNSSAKLQVDATTKGFLPPRVELVSTSNATTPISTPATGLFVYNTATAGSGATAVTPGFYYYDGSKWQRIINQQPDATVTFDKATPTTSGVTFDPPGAEYKQSKDYIYVSSTDNSQWTYNGTEYVTYTPPASTAWYLSTGTNDAGSNKTGKIYRSGNVGIGGNNSPNATLDIRTTPTSVSDPGAGFLGIGTTTTAANTAGAGAVRYSTTSGGILQYSNGSAWNTLTSTVQKTVVSGYFSGTYNQGAQRELTCNESSDATNAFASNTFTAPRTGLYLINANLLSNSRAWSAGEELNISFTVAGTDQIVSGYFSPAAITTWAGPSISAVISMTAGQTAIFRTYISINPFTVYNAVYNRFSITEL